MQTKQRRLIVRRTFLLAVVVSTMAACDRSGSPLAPSDRYPEGTVVRDGGRPATSRGMPMTREQARQKRIVDARAALAHARSGATIRLSDARELSGADAVLYWERTLHALESGLSPHLVLRAADSSGGITPMSTAIDEAGYVGGGTMVHGNLDRSWVGAWTDGFLADVVRVEGSMEVFLMYTGSYPSQQSKTVSVGYGESAYGDQVSTSAEISWDYTWQPQASAAASSHFAQYGEFVASTGTSGSR